MRHYQRKTNNPYKLPHNVYMQCLYAVKDYERIKAEREEVLHSSPCTFTSYTEKIGDREIDCRQYGLGGGGVSDPTAAKADRLMAIDKQCEAVEQAIVIIPNEYRRGVLDNIMYGAGFPDYAHRNTYSNWRKRFLHQVAVNKKII